VPLQRQKTERGPSTPRPTLRNQGWGTRPQIGEMRVGGEGTRGELKFCPYNGGKGESGPLRKACLKWKDLDWATPLLFLFCEPGEEAALGAEESSVIVHGEDGFVTFANQCHGLSALCVSAGSRNRTRGDKRFATRFELNLDNSSVARVGVAFHGSATTRHEEAAGKNYYEGHLEQPGGCFFHWPILRFSFGYFTDLIEREQ